MMIKRSSKILSIIVAFVILFTSMSLNLIVFASEQPNYFIYEGYRSLKINCVNTDAFKFYGQTISVAQNTDYSVSIWSRGGGSPSIRILNSSWSTTLRQADLKGGTIWQENTFTFNTGNNTVIIFALTNNPYGGNGNMYVDNAYLAKTSDGINIVKNPGYESGATNWPTINHPFYIEESPIYINPGDEEIVYEENVISQPNGNSNLNLYAGHTSLQYTASATPQSVTQEVTVAKNTRYIASFWTRSPDSIKIDFNAKDSLSNGLITGGQPLTVSSTTNWVRTQVEFTTMTDTKAIFTLSSRSGQSGTMYIDYCMIVPKYKPVGMSMVNLIKNLSFEDLSTSWNGIQGAFSFYRRTEGNLGDISGGVRVMTVGDSITAGVGSTSGTAGYKRGLYEKYLTYGANVNFVGPSNLGSSVGFPSGSGHAGFSGWRIDQIDNRISGWMTAYEPQVILMMIGTNDILQDNSSNNYAANAPARLEALVDKILATNSQVELYLSALTPLNNSTNDQKVVALNTEVLRIATSKGANVHFVDMYSAVLKSDLPDNVHPNDTGYAKMAQRWYDVTKDAVKNMTPHAFSPDQGTAYDGSVSLHYNPFYVPYYTLLTYEVFSKGFIAVEENTNYTLSMMIKGDQNISLQTRIQGSWSGDVFASKTATPGPKWTKNEVTFNTGSRTGFILTFINDCMSTGNMYIDCIELYQEGSEENLLTNSSMELKTNGKVDFWPDAKYPFAFVEDASGDAFHENIAIQKNGEDITKLEAGQINISADISSLSPNGFLVAALYQGNTLKNCVISNEGFDLDVSISVDSVDSNTKLKIFVFESMNNLNELMLPLTATQDRIY